MYHAQKIGVSGKQHYGPGSDLAFSGRTSGLSCMVSGLFSGTRHLRPAGKSLPGDPKKAWYNCRGK